MNTRMIRTSRAIRILPVLGLALAPVAAFAEDPVACVNVEVSASAAEVCQGGTFNLSALITNCGTSRDRVVLLVFGTGPGVGAQFLTGGRVPAGATRQRSWPVTVPPGLPPGAYTMMVIATSRHGAPPDVSAVNVNVTTCSGGGGEPGP